LLEESAEEIAEKPEEEGLQEQKIYRGVLHESFPSPEDGWIGSMDPVLVSLGVELHGVSTERKGGESTVEAIIVMVLLQLIGLGPPHPPSSTFA
jgi:hypothetical protein